MVADRHGLGLEAPICETIAPPNWILSSTPAHSQPNNDNNDTFRDRAGTGFVLAVAFARNLKCLDPKGSRPGRGGGIKAF